MAFMVTISDPSDGAARPPPGGGSRPRRADMKRLMTAGSSSSAAPHQVHARLLHELDTACASLSRPELSDDAIHEVRKGLKRARATLRLLREAIGVAAYHRNNILLRDAARPLTPIRDAKILLETLRKLTDGQVNSPFVAGLRRALGRERRRAREQLTRAEVQHIVAALHQVRDRVERIPEHALNPATLRGGLERAYRSARKAYRHACKRDSDEELHEWRKQAKYYLYQLELLSSLARDRFARRRKHTERIGERLGDDHDLAVLNEKILKYARAEHAASRDALVEDLIQRLVRRRKQLQRKAFRLGQEVFADKARVIGRKAERTLSLLEPPLR